MARFNILKSRVLPLPANDVDTDQIIAAKHLTTTTKEGLGAHLFGGWRSDPDFILHRQEYANAQTLIAGENFGCGSSREHAPWALLDWGFRVVLARSFADIFRQNALKNGLLPLTLPEQTHRAIEQRCVADPTFEVEVDLWGQTVSMQSGEIVGFEIDSFSKHCLLEGIDQLEYLLAHDREIAKYERRTGRLHL